MTKMSRMAGMLTISFLPLAGGCGGGDDAAGPQSAPSQPGAAPRADAGGPGPGAPPGKSSPELQEIMVKLAKGPNSLTPKLGQELKADEPNWGTIQGQTKEFARLAGDMSKYDPPKGTKESWADQTTRYSTAANELDKAAQAKDKDLALVAHEKLAGSCMGCHREHRVMGPGMGGPGGRMGRPGGPGGFGPPPGGPGGPPPGGPGGPPPGGPPPGGEPPK